MKPNFIHVGLVVGLNYKNPYLNPYEEFQQFKTHPQIRKFLEGGQCVSYGARALNSGGYFSIPRLTFPGGLLVGCSAGFMNVLKIKGSHTAIKSGVEAGDALFKKLTDPSYEPEKSPVIDSYQSNMEKSWVWEELHSARNIKGSFKNLYTGLIYGGFYKLFGGK
jgi:electron-transferring-flavoprotein dehydrogenase